MPVIGAVFDACEGIERRGKLNLGGEDELGFSLQDLGLDLSYAKAKATSSHKMRFDSCRDGKELVHPAKNLEFQHR